MEPTQHKSSLFLIISIIIVLGIVGGVGYYYYLKNATTKTPVTPQVKNTLTTPAGMVRDISGNIPSVFKGLVDINDVKVIQESYSDVKQGNPLTQYTIKYVTDITALDVRKFLVSELSKGVSKPISTEITQTLYSIRGATTDGRIVDVVIDSTDKDNVVVELTVLK